MNLTLSLFPEEEALAFAAGENLYTAVRQQKDVRSCIRPSAYPGLDLVPSSTLMSGIEYDLFTKWQREYILKKCLQPVKEAGDYDYILIDAPPTLGGWVMNILAASDFLIIPVEASPWGLFGLSNMFEFLSEVKPIAPDLQVAGIAVTKVDGRKNYFKQTLETLQELPARVFETHIISTAASSGRRTTASRSESISLPPAAVKNTAYLRRRLKRYAVRKSQHQESDGCPGKG